MKWELRDVVPGDGDGRRLTTTTAATTAADGGLVCAEADNV